MAAQLARVAARALRVSASPAVRASVPATPSQMQSVRSYAGGHASQGVAHGGVTLHDAAPIHTYTAKALGAVMWFWIFYRFKEDGEIFWNGHAAHFEHELHEEAHGGHHH